MICFGMVERKWTTCINISCSGLRTHDMMGQVELEVMISKKVEHFPMVMVMGIECLAIQTEMKEEMDRYPSF